ncbi:MAG: fumarylacetoacetate hydrolase family protein, partial [Stackebrandtia sp.]
MRFVSYLHDRTETLGLLLDDRVVPVSRLSPELPNRMAELIDRPAAQTTIARLADTIGPQEGIPAGEVELLAPLPRPGNLVGIGQNYRAHAAEQASDAPAEPLIFLKHTASVTHPGAVIEWDPGLATQVDYEAELAVVIGRAARRVEVDNALSYVFGYTCLNDVSARNLQFGDLQWARGKSLDGFCPMGPALLTADEIDDPQHLGI